MEARRHCPLCESYNPELLTTLAFAQSCNAVLPSEYRIVCCRECGFVYDDVSVGAATFKKYYAMCGKYVQGGIGGSGDISPVDRLRYEEIVGFIESVLNRKSVSIADVGCGKGGLLRVFKEHGYTLLHGFDPSAGCVDILRNKHGISATCAEIACLKELSAQRFDLVIISNVFEHLFTIHDAITSVDKILEDDGCVYVDVPDGSRYHEHFYAPYYSFDMEHINHFNVGMMVDAWGRHGYACLKSEELVGTPVPGRNIPMCRMLFKKVGGSGERVRTLSPGPIAGIRNFIDKSRLAENLLAEMHIPDGCCYWGCGAYAKWLLERFSETPLGQPSLIFDAGAGKSTSELINGIKIVDPSELNALTDRRFPMVITSVLYEQQIYDRLRSIDWLGPIYSGSTGALMR